MNQTRENMLGEEDVQTEAEQVKELYTQRTCQKTNNYWDKLEFSLRTQSENYDDDDNRECCKWWSMGVASVSVDLVNVALFLSILYGFMLLLVNNWTSVLELLAGAFRGVHFIVISTDLHRFSAFNLSVYLSS